MTTSTSDGVQVRAASENGVRYGCRDVAAQVALGNGSVAVTSREFTPDLEVRGLHTFLHNTESEREWLHEVSWDRPSLGGFRE